MNVKPHRSGPRPVRSSWARGAQRRRSGRRTVLGGSNCVLRQAMLLRSTRRLRPPSARGDGGLRSPEAACHARRATSTPEHISFTPRAVEKQARSCSRRTDPTLEERGAVPHTRRVARRQRGGDTHKKGPRCCWTAAAGRHIRFLSPRAAATAAATPMRRPAREEQRGVPARLAARGGVMPSAFGVLAAGLVAHEPLVMRRSPSGTSEICVSTSAPVQGARALGSGTLQWACEGKL